jgi:hypothetical protein
LAATVNKVTIESAKFETILHDASLGNERRYKKEMDALDRLADRRSWLKRLWLGPHEENYASTRHRYHYAGRFLRDLNSANEAGTVSIDVDDLAYLQRMAGS